MRPRTAKERQLCLPLARTDRGVREPLCVAGLFAGIGGVEVGLAVAGHETQLVCEIEPGARAVLAQRLPDVRMHDDVTTLRSLPRSVNLLTGGFPCQDLSQAGRTVGIKGARSGLVGEVFRLLESRPVPWVLLENVPFMLSLDGGRAMAVLVSAFERLGYRWAYRVVNSLGFGLPQRRERVLFLASKFDDPREVLLADDADQHPGPHVSSGEVACGFYWTEGTRGLGWAVDAVPTLKGGSGLGIPSPPAILLPGGRIVTPDIRDAERMQGFAAGWTQAAEAASKPTHRWKLVGNAVSVNVFSWVGQRLRHPSELGAQRSGSPIRPGQRWPRAAWNVGNGRFAADVSAFPVRLPRPPLQEWLRYPGKPLSAKATAGFLSRAVASSLRFAPGFIDAVRAHLEQQLEAPLDGSHGQRLKPRAPERSRASTAQANV